MKHDDIIDFALSDSTGRIIDITEAERGGACHCLCPSCRRPLIAKKGDVRRHHFSHAVFAQSPGACSGGAETALHRAAIQIISEWKHISLPPLVVTANHRDVVGRLTKANGSIPGEHYWIENSRQPDREKFSQDWIPDLILYGPKGELRIEVKVTHGVSPVKKSRIERDGIPTLEFDLSSMHSGEGWTLSSLENRLRTDEKIARWIFHPDYAALKKRLERQAELDRIADSTIRTNTVSGCGSLVFHPWFGLIPADLKTRREFIEKNFGEPKVFALDGGVSMKVRKHALIADSWLISFYDDSLRIPHAGYYDALFSEHLQGAGYQSVYLGYPNVRVITNSKTMQPILEFCRMHSGVEVHQGENHD